jgi:hypothetical protein
MASATPHTPTGTTGTTTGTHRLRPAIQMTAASTGSPLLHAGRGTSMGEAGSPGAQADDAASSYSPLPSVPATPSLPELSPDSRAYRQPVASMPRLISESSMSTLEESSSTALTNAWTSTTGDLRQDHMSLNELAEKLAGLHGCGPAGMAGQDRTLVLTSCVRDAHQIRRMGHLVPELDFLSSVAIESHHPLVDFKWVYGLYFLNDRLKKLEIRTGAGKDLSPFVEGMTEYAKHQGRPLGIEHIWLAVAPAPEVDELVAIMKVIVKQCPKLQVLDVSALRLVPETVAAVRGFLIDAGKDGLLYI